MLGPKYKSHLSYSVSDGVTQNGGGSYTPFGQTQAYKDLMEAWKNGGTFGLINSNGAMKWWTDIPDSYDEDGNFVKGVGQFNILKLLNNNLIGLVNDIEGASHSLMKYQTEDFFKDSEKHLNGGLGLSGMALNGYNKLSNSSKIRSAYLLSAVTGIRAGKIFSNAEGFAKSFGKISKGLGVVGTALTVGVTAYEFGSGTWDAHTVINTGLIAATAVATFVTAPAVVAAAPFILGAIAVYGVADYMFGINDKIDANFGRKSTFWYP